MSHLGQNRWVELRLYWACMLPFMLKPTPWVQAQALRWLGWLPKPCHTRSALGFTLAELLIALAILGVIATFTIPKIIVGQQNSSYNAIAKEAAATISAAYQQAKLAGTVSTSTKASDLTPYMNYIKYDTSGTILDNYQTATFSTCNTFSPCVKLHSGGTLVLYDAASFSGSNTTNAIWFVFDPDSVYSGTTNGPGKAVDFALYYDGRLSSLARISANTVSADGTRNPNASYDPSWFNWDN
jgi:prepilin-type N-terminal cleavage/methylation domain-containing protein